MWNVLQGKIIAVTVALVATYLCSNPPAWAQFTQQGSKLVGRDTPVELPSEGGVALSADGNTAILGRPQDYSGRGAAWIFTRANGVWSQQGGKLRPSDEAWIGAFGHSVALSGDGSTALIGGADEDGLQGAAWIFTRNDGSWTQQGSKLVGGVGTNHFGLSVALSADGTTALIGSYSGAWVFARNDGAWSQQGIKLVGIGVIGQGDAGQGISVALSADGNTAIVGGPGDDDLYGAAWVFTRVDGVWTQQGKLVGTRAGGPDPRLGTAVSLSADGNIALVGGTNFGHFGAFWTFVRRDGVWKQLGVKVSGTGASGNSGQGRSVAMSADGQTALIGGPSDNDYQGATWAFSRSGARWEQQGPKIVGSGSVKQALQGLSVAISADGNTALIGGPFDDNVGAAWVFVQLPIISSVGPSSGAAGKPERVIITGKHFSGATAVAFGQAPARTFRVVDDTKIVAVTPIHRAGFAPLWVTTPAGKVGKAKAFIFE